MYSMYFAVDAMDIFVAAHTWKRKFDLAGNENVPNGENLKFPFVYLQTMEGRAIGGGDVEFNDRASRRGRGYLCLRCVNETNQSYINTLVRMKNHILQTHLKTSQVPFFCTLCQFRSLKWDDLVKHCTQNRKHKEIVEHEEITDSSPFLIQNITPYEFGSMDFVQLEQKDSRETFARRAQAACEAKKRLPQDIERCFQNGFLDEAFANGTVTEDAGVSESRAVVQKDLEAWPTGMYMPVKEAENNNFTINSWASASRTGNQEEGASDFSNEQEYENLVGDSADQGMESSVANESIDKGLKRSVITSVDEGSRVVPLKIQKQEDTRTVIDMEKLNQGTLVGIISRLVEATERNTRTMERIEDLLVDNTSILSKTADAVARLKWTLERYEKKETERERARQEFEKRREEERKRETERWQRQTERWTEGARRRGDWRREPFACRENRAERDDRGKRDYRDRRDDRDNRDGKNRKDRSDGGDSKEAHDTRDDWKFERRDGNKENHHEIKSVVNVV